MNNRKPAKKNNSYAKKGGERSSYSDKPKRPFTKNERDEKPKKYADRADRKRSYTGRDDGDRPRRSFDKNNDKSFDKPRRNAAERGEGRVSYSDRPKRSFDNNRDDKPKRNFDDRNDRKFDKPKRSFDKENNRGFDKPRRRSPERGEEHSYSDRPKRSFDKDNDREFDKPRRNSAGRVEESSYNDKPKKNFSRVAKAEDENLTEGQKKRKARSFSDNKARRAILTKEGGYSKARKSYGEGEENYADDKSKRNYDNHKDRGYERKPFAGKKFTRDAFKKKEAVKTNADKGLTRLNKYIANAGICSRREADDLIKTGCVTVNGKIITELGYTLKKDDVVTYSGTKIKAEKPVYLLLNKPKDYITTAEDERGRRTVMELVKNACKERIYPVGRLDRNTTGLLLFTNDGELTKKLTHPTHEIKKLYHVELDKNFKPTDFDKLKEGIELEDGFIKPDELSYAGESKREVGIEIHSGRNRIVRRMFEHLGYDVVKLDRVMMAGLTKKDLPKGRYRFLTEKEIAFLKMMK